MRKENETREIAGQEFEVISTYGDEQSVEDGNIVAVGGNDRVTIACYAWIAASLPTEGSPPNGWPVELMGWCTGDKSLAAVKGLIGSHSSQARRVWDENIGGGVYKLFADMRGAVIRGLSGSETTDDVELWLIPNEVGGITLMFPSDY
jgi:hypothetical protein